MVDTHQVRSSRLILLAGLLMVLFWTQGALAETSDDILVLTDPKTSYRQAAKSLISQLEKENITCIHLDLPDSKSKTSLKEFSTQFKEKIESHPPRVIVTAGSKSSRLAIQTTQTIPIVFLMVPNARDRIYADNSEEIRDRVAGVPADISPVDQLEWISLVDPECKRLAVLFSKRTKETTRAIQDKAIQLNIDILAIEAEKKDFGKAIDHLISSKADGVLMIPDAEVYNGASIKRLILWGIRQKKPVWAFSPSVVKPGAFACIYAKTEDVGIQGADIVVRILKGESPDKIGIEYPNRTTKVVNTFTAEKIGISDKGPGMGGTVTRLSPKK